MNVTLFSHEMDAPRVVAYLDDESPFAVVRMTPDATLHMNPSVPASLARARALASAINDACNRLEDDARRRAPVPIESLAPDVEAEATALEDARPAA